MKQFLFLFSWEDIILKIWKVHTGIYKKKKKACLQQSQDLQCHAVSAAFLFSLTQKKILIP